MREHIKYALIGLLVGLVCFLAWIWYWGSQIEPIL